MKVKDAHHIRLSAALLSPVERFDDTPVWGKALALLVAACQFVTNDLFTGALAILILVGIIDYGVGVKAARWKQRYRPELAHAGAMGKVSGTLLALLFRLIEAWAFGHALINTNGALATAITVSLIAVDLKSIAHHREEFGAKPIPILSRVFEWMQSWAASRVPPAPPPPPPLPPPGP